MTKAVPEQYSELISFSLTDYPLLEPRICVAGLNAASLRPSSRFSSSDFAAKKEKETDGFLSVIILFSFLQHQFPISGRITVG